MKVKLLVLFLLFLLLVTAGSNLITPSLANPAPLFSFPTKSIMTSPTINVTSPAENQTYTSTNLLLNVTIIKPETWFAIDVGSHMDHTPITQTSVNITSIYYRIDNGQPQNITIHDIDSLFDTQPIFSINFSTPLNLTFGSHSIRVGLEADSYYVVRYTYNLSDALSSVKLYAESAPINFRIATNLELTVESSPIIPVSAAITVIAIVSASLLYYYKRHSQKKLPD